MTTLLRLGRLLATCCWFQVAALVALLIFPLGWGGIRRVTWAVRLWGRGLCWIVGLRIRVVGALPPALSCGLIVSNHLSYLDVLLHAAMCPARFAPKAEIAWWPVLGWYLALSRPIWVNRKSRQQSGRTMRQFAETLAHGIALIVYPEGTSTDGRHGLLPFKSTPFEAATANAAAIQPVLIRYLEPVGRPPVCWFGDAPLCSHVWQVLGFSRIEAEIRFLPPVPSAGRDRKTLAVELHALMEQAYREWPAAPRP